MQLPPFGACARRPTRRISRQCDGVALRIRLGIIILVLYGFALYAGLAFYLRASRVGAEACRVLLLTLALNNVPSIINIIFIRPLKVAILL